MQELAFEAAGPDPATVAQVTGDREVEIGEVRPNLVRAAGERVECQQGVAAARGEHLVRRHRLAAVGDDCHPLPVARIAADGRLHPAAGRRRVAPHEGEVLLLDRALAELAHEARLGLVGLRHQEEPGGVLVEPMHDPRPLDAGDAAEPLAACPRPPE